MEAFLVTTACQETGKSYIKRLAGAAQTLLDLAYHANLGHPKQQDIKDNLQNTINNALEYAEE